MSRNILLTDLLTFACQNNSKIPATKHGYHDAIKQDVNLLHNKGYNVGLAMRSNHLICLDVDGKNEKTGIQDLLKLELLLGKLPLTLIQKSCSNNSFHLIYSDEGIICPRGNIGENNSIDIRWNGYILCEPSIINGNQYRFINGIDEFGNVTIAKLPEKWIEYINCKTVGNNSFKGNCSNNNATHKPKLIKNCDLDTVFNRCKFLQYCRTESAKLSELAWFSMISLLAPVEGSEQLIHELSAPYPTYSFEETDYKIKRARLFGKPQSCRYISSQYPNICKGCCSNRNKENK
jgi:hypothetical protein